MKSGLKLLGSLLGKFVAVLMLAFPLLSRGSEAVLLSATEITTQINLGSEYQLIDARNILAQKKSGIDNAIRYGAGMPIKSGWVLVLADTDAEALAIAKSIAQGSGRKVSAVKGGIVTWQQVVSAIAHPEFSMPDSFVIPMNTCEQGKPLQELKRK